ncbi:MAG: hypothetical protein PHQ35_01135 [Phycisphaerae bacterium]|nr:hypothetical protein [Phycisphaerae bacterium]MDD5381330.1 hypothetical protein [Phycisphaerae bacterium]
MNYWLAQLVLAARNSNEDNTWMQILGFVILAIFYAVGSILKAKANKTTPKGKEQAPGKPVRKPPEDLIDLKMLKQLFGLPEEAESSGQPSPEVSKPLVRVMRPAVARQAVVSQVQPKLAKVTVEADVPLISAEHPATGAEIPRTKYLSEILSDYKNPESLRRAILHYEILGKPISLRAQSEHII